MLFWRAKELLEGGGELLRAEAELAGMRVKRMLVSLAVFSLLGAAGLIGLLAVLAGLSILIARTTGWGVSLLIVGGGVLSVCSIGAAIALKLGSPDQAEAAAGSIGSQDTPPEGDVELAKERMSRAVEDEPDQEEDSALPGLDGIKDEAIDFAVRNPLAIGSAALLVVSAIGPVRSARLISRGVATASMVGTIIDAFSDQKDDDPEPSGHARNGQAHGSGHEHVNRTAPPA